MENTTDQATSNAKSGLAGAIGIAAGTAVLGGSAGPIVGGIAAGSLIDGAEGDDITRTGMMLAGYHLASRDIRGGGSSGSSRGAM